MLMNLITKTLIMPKKYHKNSSTLLIFLSLITVALSKSTIIPLTYVTDPQSTRKYPIKLSFNQSYTTAPFSSQYLPLYNTNLTMDLVSSYNFNAVPNSNDKQVVTIGLKPPSVFLTAVQSTFAVQPHQIQFDKDQYLQLVLNDNNFVQSTDQFVNNQVYNAKITYNYGDALSINDQRCQLIDDDQVYFDQFLILEILNSMDKRNKIKFTKNQSKGEIYLDGKVENFPKISFTKDKSIFQIQLKSAKLLYLPRPNNKSQSLSLIGYKSLTQFSKFQISPNSPQSPSSSSSSSSSSTKIVFKRTSQLYQLYLFLGYFFIFTLVLIVFSREKLQGSMKFIRNVIQWVFMNNRNARIRVLRTQLQ